MKTLLLQVNIKPDGFKEVDHRKPNTFDWCGDLYSHSNQNCKEWAKRMGCDYYLIEDMSHFPDLHPAFHRFAVFLDKFKEYDQFIYCDSDWIPHEMTPDISKWAAKRPEVFFARSENGLKGYEEVRYRPFNSGFFVIKRPLIEELSEVYLETCLRHTNSSFKDQNAWNEMISKHYPAYCHLSLHWNGIFAQVKPLFAVHYVMIRKELYTERGLNKWFEGKKERMKGLSEGEIDRLHTEDELVIDYSKLF